MCLVRRLEALQCAVRESVTSMQAADPTLELVLEEKQIEPHKARCAACEQWLKTQQAPSDAEAEPPGRSPCACGCGCRQETCVCNRELLVSISGVYGVLNVCMPLSRADELGLPLGCYTLKVLGGGDTGIQSISTDDNTLHLAVDGCAECCVTENEREVRVKLESGCELCFPMQAVLLESGEEVVAYTGPYLQEVEKASAKCLALDDEIAEQEDAMRKDMRLKRRTAGTDVPGELAALGRNLLCAQEAAASIQALCGDITLTAGDFVGLMAPTDCVTTQGLQITTSAKAAAMRQALEKLETSTSGALAHGRAVETAAVDLKAIKTLLAEKEAIRVLRLAEIRADVLRALAPGPGVSVAGFLRETETNMPITTTEAESLEPKHTRQWFPARVSTAADRRSLYIVLSSVDSALRARASCIGGRGHAKGVRDAKMCAYQLRQVMATDAYNDVKLNTAVFERCLSLTNEAQALAALPQDSTTASKDIAPAVSMLRAAKVLEAIESAASKPYLVAPALNYEYRQKNMPATRHWETGTADAEARTELAAMADVDLRHRVISPLVHKCVRAACAGTAKIPESEIVAAFAKDVQPLARLALCKEPCKTPYAFLEDTSVRTGYNEEHKTKLLIKLMFDNNVL
jgi:hypothetical protein